MEENKNGLKNNAELPRENLVSKLVKLLIEEIIELIIQVFINQIGNESGNFSYKVFTVKMKFLYLIWILAVLFVLSESSHLLLLLKTRSVFL